jgi:hypothetical protein
MNKAELDALLESCIRHLQSRTPEQIKKMQETFDSWPSNVCFSFPDGFEPVLPNENVFSKNFFISIKTEYKVNMDKMSTDYLNGYYYDIYKSIYNAGDVVGQVPDFIDPAA